MSDGLVDAALLVPLHLELAFLGMYAISIPKLFKKKIKVSKIPFTFGRLVDDVSRTDWFPD